MRILTARCYPGVDYGLMRKGRLMSVILVPFDGSAHALKALHIAMDLTEKYKAPLVLVHVAGAEKAEAQLPEVQRIKAMAESKMRHRQVNPLAFEVVFGAAADCILLAAKRHKATTIVMGCRGQALDDRVMFGSVSQEVFREAGCTCISVK